MTYLDDNGVAARGDYNVLAGTPWFFASTAMRENPVDVLVVSQFTLYGDTRKGRRPGYSDAAPGLVAEPLVDAVVDELRELGARVATGRFGADMAVSLVNDGPVTLWIEV